MDRIAMKELTSHTEITRFSLEVGASVFVGIQKDMSFINENRMKGR